MEELNSNRQLKVLHVLPVYLPNSQIWLYNAIACTPDAIPIIAAEKYTDNVFNPAPFRFLKAPLQGYGGMLAKLATRLFFKPKLVGAVKAIQPDIIHAHFSIMGWKYKELVQSAPLVTSFYGFDYERLPYTNPEWKQRYKELFKLGTLFLCEGEHGKNTLLKMDCPEEKIQVTPLGMVSDTIPVYKREKQENQLRLLQIAPFRYKKGQIYTVKAFAEALKQAPNMHLTLIGDDVEGGLKEVKAFIQQEGIQDKVTIKSGVPYNKLHEQMQGEDVFIHPSCYAHNMDCEGGAPMVLVDAQMTGMPVISTTHCDIPSVVLEGKTGFLSAEKDIKRLQDSIITFYKMGNEVYQKMSHYAQQHARNNFNAEECGLKLREIYETLLT